MQRRDANLEQALGLRDPYVVQLFARSATMQKPWVKALQSSHVWKAPLPAGLGLGVHRLTVHASDEYGRQHVAHMLLEVGRPVAAAAPA